MPRRPRLRHFGALSAINAGSRPGYAAARALSTGPIPRRTPGHSPAATSVRSGTPGRASSVRRRPCSAEASSWPAPSSYGSSSTSLPGQVSDGFRVPAQRDQGPGVAIPCRVAQRLQPGHRKLVRGHRNIELPRPSRGRAESRRCRNGIRTSRTARNIGHEWTLTWRAVCGR